MQLIFVRHGEPLRMDYGISEMGKEELKLLSEFLMKNYEVDSIISATSQRAKESAEVINSYFNKNVIYYDWLSEFKYRISCDDYKNDFPWEFPPEYWINNDELLDYKTVFETSFFLESDVPKKSYEVWTGLDKIIKDFGYERIGNMYKVNNPNKSVIIIVSHFATIAIILAHLLNVSVLVTLNMLFMAPSSYTVFSTEEIKDGSAIFRCLEMGSTKHLYEHNDLKSEYGRQDEIKGKE